MKVSEPVVAYNTAHLQGLRNRLIALIDQTSDERKLQDCLDLLQAKKPMPCMFTEEELDAVIDSAEKEGFASREEVDITFQAIRMNH